MRGLKSTLVLLVLLVGLVGYLYFVDRNKPAGDAEVKDKAIAGVDAGDIERIRITSSGGETSVLQKTDGRWQITEPVKADADATELSSITASLAAIDVQRVVDEHASDLKQYGLDPPRLEVAFQAKGKKEERVLFGEKTPAGGDLYARLPDQPRVFLVSSYLDTTFDKSAFALRDKRVLTFDRTKVDGLELVSGDTTVEFRKTGMEWRIVRPIAARADFGTVEGTLERLASTQMLAITAADGGVPKQYGLETPSASMTVIAGSSRATLALGRTEHDAIFAKDSSRPMIFTLAPTITTDVFKPLSDYRRQDLFDARSFTATKATFTRGTDTITIEKTKDTDGKEIWKNGAGKTIDGTKVEDLLAKITSLRAQSFDAATNPATASPALTVTAQFDPGRSETVAFARSGADVLAARTDEPGTAHVESMGYDDALKALDAAR